MNQTQSGEHSRSRFRRPVIFAILFLVVIPGAISWRLLRILYEKQAFAALRLTQGCQIEVTQQWPQPARENAFEQFIRELTDGGSWSANGMRIVFDGTPNVGQALKHLPYIRRIDSLAIVSPTLTDSDLDVILSCPNIESLSLNAPRLTAAGFAKVAKVPTRRMAVDSALATNETLREFAQNRALTQLAMKNCPIDDAGLAALKGHPRLWSVSLSRAAITDAGLKAFTEMPALEHLSLTHMGITNEGLKTLSTIPSIELLELDGTAITDAGVTLIPAHWRLKMLDLANTAITDDGLGDLNACPTLLYLEGSQVALQEGSRARRWIEKNRPPYLVVGDKEFPEQAFRALQRKLLPTNLSLSSMIKRKKFNYP